MADDEKSGQTGKASAKTKHADAEIDKIIDQWVRDSFHSTAVARDTETFNVVMNAVVDLKKRLKGA